VRGFLGVKLPRTIDDGVIDQLNLGAQRGALLAGVQPGSPADQAHLQANDFITEVDGHAISGVADLRLIVSQLPIGKEVVVNYIRDGKPQSATVKIIEVPADVESGSDGEDGRGNGNSTLPDAGNGPPDEETVLSGLQVSDLNDKSRQKFSVDPMVTAGVVVSGVQDNSSADEKGIQVGDVIESACVNRGSTLQLAGAKDFVDVTKDLKPDQSVVLLVHHGKTSSFIYLAPQK
jgi:serine protease Do